MASKEAFTNLRMVLVGKTGSGKSSCGNTILGNDAFKSAVSHSSVTRECSKQTGQVYGCEVTLVDTPGLFDTHLPKDTIEREISKCINMSAPGPHAILIVVPAGTFTKEERNAVNKVEEIFGKDCWRYTMILFTRGDQVASVAGGIDLCVNEAGEDLKIILRKMEGRYHVFNNANINYREQVLQLLEKVDQMVTANEGQYYSNPTYLDTVKMLKEREAELKEWYKKKLEEETQTLVSHYALKQSEWERKLLGMKKKELKRYYRALVSRARHVVEQVPRKDNFEDIRKAIHETLKVN